MTNKTLNCIINDINGNFLDNCFLGKINWYINKNLATVVSKDPLTIKLKFETNKKSNREEKPNKKSKIFDNCMIQDMHGEDVNRCSVKKANWYINKNLATVVNEKDPFIIKLNFKINESYFKEKSEINEKPNLCVVCGISENLTRHHIVPYCFIRHMKKDEKINMHKDILGLCRNCHDTYENHSYEKKKDLSKIHGISIDSHKSSCIKERMILSASKALLDENIPEPKKIRISKNNI